MRQFQGSLGPLQNLEGERQATRPRVRLVQEGDEPSNHELGIEPYRGWRFYLPYVAAIVLVLLGYAWLLGSWPFSS